MITQITKQDDFVVLSKLLNIAFATIPDYRHLGIGKRLMDFASNRIVELGGKRISIGLINSNIVLKNWYDKLGYVERAVKTFEHLPFEVCIMEK